MSKISGIGGMEKSTQRSLGNKFNGRNFTHKSKQSKFEGRLILLKDTSTIVLTVDKLTSTHQPLRK